MGLYPFDINVPQGTRGENAAGKFQDVSEILFARELINTRSPYHAFERNLAAHGGDKEGVSGLQPLHAGAEAAPKDDRQIDLLHQLIAAIVLHHAHGSARSRTTRLIKGV